MMTSGAICAQYFNWLTEELSLLLDSIEKQIEEGKSSVLKLTTYPSYTSFQEVDLTLRELERLFDKNASVQCASSGLIDHEFEQPIDQFFQRMHIIGHVFSRGLITVDSSNMHDAALEEFACSIFAILATKRYFNIAKLTEAMSQTIWDCTKDIEKLIKAGESAPSAQERAKLAGEIFIKFLDSEKEGALFRQ